MSTNTPAEQYPEDPQGTHSDQRALDRAAAAQARGVDANRTMPNRRGRLHPQAPADPTQGDETAVDTTQGETRQAQAPLQARDGRTRTAEHTPVARRTGEEATVAEESKDTVPEQRAIDPSPSDDDVTKIAHRNQADVSAAKGTHRIIPGIFIHAADKKWRLDAALAHTVGRHPESKIRLEDLSVSSRHGTITYTFADGWRFTDHGSSNGTFVNGRKVTSVGLQSGMTIMVGGTDGVPLTIKNAPPQKVATDEAPWTWSAKNRTTAPAPVLAAPTPATPGADAPAVAAVSEAAPAETAPVPEAPVVPAPPADPFADTLPGVPAVTDEEDTAVAAQGPTWPEPTTQSAAQPVVQATQPVAPIEPPLDPQAGRPRSRRRFGKARNADDPTAPSADKPYRKAKVTAPKGEDFYVPVPGGRLAGGRGMSMAMRWTIIAIVVLLCLGACAVGGMIAVAAARGDGDGLFSKEDRSRYHLDTWNTDAGTAFAARYLRLCLWKTTGATETSRRATLKTLGLDGQDGSCTYDAPTTAKPVERTVVDATYTGHSETVPGMDQARYLSMLVITSDGETSEYVVPVWLGKPVEGTQPRVVGAIGAVPATDMGQPGDYARGGTVDTQLSSTLAETFVADYMTAWAASSSTLSQYVTSDATRPAKVGLHGQYTAIKVASVTARPPKSVVDEADTKFTYHDGDVVEADVTVVATGADGQTQDVSYRLTLKLAADRWFVSDLRGGLVRDISGEDGDEGTP